MKYERYPMEEIGLGPFASIAPKGAKLYQSIKLPTIKLKIDKVYYEFTDFRYLNEWAVDIFEGILTLVANTPDVDKATFTIPPNTPKDKIQLISDIVTSAMYKVEKKGKDRFMVEGHLLVGGSHTEIKENDGGKITFYIQKSDAQAVYEYAQVKGKCDLLNVCKVIAENTLRGFKEFYREVDEC